METIDLLPLYKVEITETCWLWTGAKDKKGYGVFRFSGSVWLVHRLFYTYLVQYLDTRLVLDHICEIKNCVNPDHLEEVTIGENVRRSHSREPQTLLPMHVTEINGSYMVRIAYNGKRHYFGCYGSINEASYVAEQAQKVISSL